MFYNWGQQVRKQKQIKIYLQKVETYQLLVLKNSILVLVKGQHGIINYSNKSYISNMYRRIRHRSMELEVTKTLFYNVA
jgi:hypothetical protein